MANTYSTELQPTQQVPAQRTSAVDGYGARRHRYRASITLAAQAIADTITLANVPAGYVFDGGKITTDTSLSTSTIAIGVAGTAGYFKAAGTQTATNTPTPFGNAAALAETDTAARTVILTVAALALPAAGQLVVDLYFSSP
jgi:hypothetical protein